MKRSTFSAFPPEGLQFLRALKRNNNREWFQEHKYIYESHVKRPINELIEAIGVELKSFAPEMVASPKVSAYRIHRDTRFSRDKTPYKTHVAAVFPRAGLGKHEGAGFYLQVAPSELLIGGGLYMPFPEDLQAVRTHIAENFEDLAAIVKRPGFRKLFGSIQGEQLSRVPRGFNSDHPAAEYLRHKQFLVARSFDGRVATTGQFFKLVIETFRGMSAFVRFLNQPIVAELRVRERQQALLAF
jgi:uncharacterized protein (TIGR02453 family)